PNGAQRRREPHRALEPPAPAHRTHRGMSTGPTMIPSSDGVRIAVHDLGGPDDPETPALLFSHPTGFCGLAWAPVAAFLADRFRCLALDYRGHGMSEAPEE